MTKLELRRAARLLRQHAAVMVNSYTDCDGNWTGDPEGGYPGKRAERDYNDHRDLARKLTALARRAA